MNDLTYPVDTRLELVQAIQARPMSLYEPAPETLGLAEIIASSQEVYDLAEALLSHLEERK